MLAQFFLYFKVVDSYTYLMTKEEYLKSLDAKPNTTQSALYVQYRPEILSGLALKKKYLESIGATPEQVLFTPGEYEYMADKANIIPYAYKTIGLGSTDPDILAGEQSGRNELLANYPIYKALLEENK